MHKYLKKSLIISILLSFSTYSLALTEQLERANSYQPKEITELKLSFDDTDPNLKKEQKKILEQYLGEHVTIKKDIGPSTKKHPMVFLIKYIYGLEQNNLYDEKFVKFIKQKQKDNGLIETGVLDLVTWFSVFPQPLEWEKETINNSINNWKNILSKHSSHKNDKMIVVNIPNQHLFLYQRNNEGYKLLLKSKVVIGKLKHQTPLKDFEINSLKINPTWTPTDNMLARNLFDQNGDLNIEWIESHGLILYDEEGKERPLEELGSIKNPKFMQPPGDDNALGNLKFETTSKDDIYLHDTNEKLYFKHNTRTYSSGCIRVQDYLELAKNISNLSEKKILDLIEEGEVKYSPVKRVPVYFDYSQVYFKDNGSPSFYPDIYNKNKD